MQVSFGLKPLLLGTHGCFQASLSEDASFKDKCILLRGKTKIGLGKITQLLLPLSGMSNSSLELIGLCLKPMLQWASLLMKSHSLVFG